jgi:pyruvate/2-oxoacid:ferredoxin oxidoreductase beta subunit
VHGRALPVATGLKLARPDLTVLVTGGDGDGFSIGGNHFLHACRRNVDLTYIVMDNQVYGMTKGQASPTTAPDWEGSKLTPEGTGINPFQPLVVGLASGANFIARVSASDPINMAQDHRRSDPAIRAFHWCRYSAPASPSAPNSRNGATSCAPPWWITPTMPRAPRAA